MSKNNRKKHIWFSFIVLFLVAFFSIFFLLSKPLFDDPYSPVLFDKDGALLSARIAADGQWRFPESEIIPEKIEQAIVLYEDAYFYKHLGFNPISMLRAAYWNAKSGKVVSGGSTISMQLIRLSRKGQKRTYSEKLRELFLSLSLEMHYSKDQILAMYLSHAPFGGNVVGIEAASWRYFACAAADLSWAESALLAVLPNAPSLVNVGRNRTLLKEKRDRLLQKLLENEKIDSLSYELALAEEIPEQPQPLPDDAPHYLELFRKTSMDKPVKSAIDKSWQQIAKQVLETHYRQLSGNFIRHAAVIVKSVNTGEILVYQGNIPCYINSDGCYNDMIQTRRSSGSVLKPFLYAAALQQGIIQPNSLLPDIPSWIGGYVPKNFSEKYQGAVSAGEALRQSLNIPFVLLLRQFGIEKFHRLLNNIGLTTFDKPAAHYGLSMILGGGEVTLFELTEVYRKIAFQLKTGKIDNYPLDRSSLYLTTLVLQELNRPKMETGWSYAGSNLKIAWKTGTSYGFRDAWAVGYTPDLVIGVWVGNAEGDGRPGLTGSLCAAPILFDLAEKIIPINQIEFEPPYDELVQTTVCSKSGFLAGVYCDHKESVLGHFAASKSVVCPYCKPIQLDESGNFRVNPDCDETTEIQIKNFFVLPPLMANYYIEAHLDYENLPPYKNNCTERSEVMEFVYPPNNAKIFRPKTYSTEANPIVFEVAHRQDDALLYWYLGNCFIGETSGKSHRMKLTPEYGKNEITVVDLYGNRLKQYFEIVSNNH